MKKIYVLGVFLVFFAIFMIVYRTGASGHSNLNSETNEVSGKTRSSHSSVGDRANSKASREPTIREVWGEIIDPAEDCRFSMKEDRLRVWIPGSEVPHDMNPEKGTVGSSDSPRLLQPVAGDFTIQVKIGGEFAPGEESTQPGHTGYNGAGLLVFANEANFVRFERATLQRRGSEERPYTNLEIRVEGVIEYYSSLGDLPTEANKPTWLRLERRGDNIYTSMSQDGVSWIKNEPQTLTAEAWQTHEIEAGILAVSTSKEVFNPEFSELNIQ